MLMQPVLNDTRRLPRKLQPVGGQTLSCAMLFVVVNPKLSNDRACSTQEMEQGNCVYQKHAEAPVFVLLRQLEALKARGLVHLLFRPAPACQSSICARVFLSSLSQ